MGTRGISVFHCLIKKKVANVCGQSAAPVTNISFIYNQFINIKELKNCSKYERVQSKKGISAQRKVELPSFLVNALSRAISRRASIWRRLDLLFCIYTIIILFTLPYSSNILWGE